MKNTYLKEVHGDGVMVESFGVVDEVVVILMEMKEEEDEGNKLE